MLLPPSRGPPPRPDHHPARRRSGRVPGGDATRALHLRAAGRDGRCRGPSDGRAGALPDGRAGALPAAVAASIVPVASAGPPEGMASGGPTAGASPPGGQRLGAVRAPDTPTALTGGPPDTAWTRGGEVAPDSRAQAASVQPQLALLGFDRGREACPG